MLNICYRKINKSRDIPTFIDIFAMDISDIVAMDALFADKFHLIELFAGMLFLPFLWAKTI